MDCQRFAICALTLQQSTNELLCQSVPTLTVQGQHYNKPKCQKGQSRRNPALLLGMSKVLWFVLLLFFSPHNFISDRIIAHLTHWLIIILVTWLSVVFLNAFPVFSIM